MLSSLQPSGFLISAQHKIARRSSDQTAWWTSLLCTGVRLYPLIRLAALPCTELPREGLRCRCNPRRQAPILELGVQPSDRHEVCTRSESTSRDLQGCQIHTSYCVGKIALQGYEHLQIYMDKINRES